MLQNHLCRQRITFIDAQTQAFVFIFLFSFKSVAKLSTGSEAARYCRLTDCFGQRPQGLVDQPQIH
jgi:hypothetical protein